MSEQIASIKASHRGGLVAGSLLIVAGLFSLASLLFPQINLELYILLVLGICFLAWGSIIRKGGLMIPGGILTGLGAGTILVGNLSIRLQEPVTGGIFILCFAGGFALITLFTALFASRAILWPLFPAGFMALFGGALLFQATGLFNFLHAINFGWPVMLIAVGLYLILRRRGMQN